MGATQTRSFGESDVAIVIVTGRTTGVDMKKNPQTRSPSSLSYQSYSSTLFLLHRAVVCDGPRPSIVLKTMFGSSSGEVATDQQARLEIDMNDEEAKAFPRLVDYMYEGTPMPKEDVVLVNLAKKFQTFPESSMQDERLMAVDSSTTMMPSPQVAFDYSKHESHQAQPPVSPQAGFSPIDAQNPPPQSSPTPAQESAPQAESPTVAQNPPAQEVPPQAGFSPIVAQSTLPPTSPTPAEDASLSVAPATLFADTNADSPFVEPATRFANIIAQGVESFCSMSKNVGAEAHQANWIFVCRCPYCVNKGVVNAKTMQFSKQLFVGVTWTRPTTTRKAHPRKVYLDEHGYVDYNASIPTGHLNSRKRSLLRRHLTESNLDWFGEDALPISARVESTGQARRYWTSIESKRKRETDEYEPAPTRLRPNPPAEDPAAGGTVPAIVTSIQSLQSLIDDASDEATKSLYGRALEKEKQALEAAI